MAKPGSTDAAGPDRRRAPEAFTITDAAVLAGLPVLAAVAWLAPVPAWRAVVAAGIPFYGLGRRGEASLAEVREAMTRTLGGRDLGHPPEAVLRALIAEDVRTRIELLRDYRPGGWTPAIAVTGCEHLEAALARGRGALLWVGHFVHGNLVAKMALHRAGYAVSHLSHPRHGFSESRFGRRWLNRVMTVIEDRYIAERLMLSDDSPAAAVQRLLRRLADNRVVSISVRDTALAPRVVSFLDGRVALPPGPPGLAAKSGAALLPVFPVRTADGAFTVFIEPPLAVDADAPRDATAEAALIAYAAVLERYVLAWPEQWLGWLRL